MRRRFYRWLRRALAGGTPLVLAMACQPHHACAPASALSDIGAAEVQTAVAACKGYPSKEVCPAWPAIREHYDMLRERWALCR